MSKVKRLPPEVLEKREKGFDMKNLNFVTLKEYNALNDPNMRHFFESKNNQLLLYRTGQIDAHGRVIDYEKNKSKLNILEREFKEAERIEAKRLKEEEEMRHRVQRKRFNELERAKKAEILERLKAERELSKEILGTLNLSKTGGFDARAAVTKKNTTHSVNRTASSSSPHPSEHYHSSSDPFFVTESDH